MTPRQFVMLVGALAIAAGLAFLLVPSSVEIGIARSSGSCGSAIAPSDDAEVKAGGADLGAAMAGASTNYTSEIRTECADALSTRRMTGWPLLAAGVLAVFGALVVQQRPAASPPA